LIRVDVRIMAASNLDLAAEVEAGEFRRDLFYRLGVVTLELPALRDRREDVPGLVESYIRFYGDAIGRDVEDIDPDALDALVRYSWPGNVRELMNVVERAVLLCDGTRITLESLPAGIRGGARGGALPALPAAEEADLPPSWLERPLREARRECLDLFERAYLAGLLREAGGRIGETARRAGIGPRSLHAKLKRLGLRKEDFKVPGVDR
jgi:DNA-binding NtrC family response regulator